MSGAPYIARAIYLNKAGRYQEALNDIGEAMSIALHKGIKRTYSETAYVQAVILKNLGRYDDALSIVEWGLQSSIEAPPQDAVNLRDEIARLVINSHANK
jgi:tetratricopeptide (TPR) repeat protein